MNRTILYMAAILSSAFIMAGCVRNGAAEASEPVRRQTATPLPPLSHNDSLRFKITYFEAMNMQLNGDYDAAYDLLRRCMEINPNAAEAYFLLSSYDGIIKGDSAALEDMKKASELDPDNNTYLERLATGYLKTENFDEAISAYEKLYHNTPQRSDVLDLLVRLYAQKKDYPNMLDALERIETLEGSSEQTALAKMRIYSLQGKKKEEFNELKSMSDKHPNDMNYVVMMGNWLLQNGKPQEAYEKYRYALGLEPDNSMAQMSIIDYYNTVGQKQKADSIQEAVLTNPKTPAENKISMMRQIVSNNEKDGGDSTKVLGIFRKILSTPQETSDMAELYAAYMTLKKMPQDSISKALETALEISPDNKGVRISLIQAYWKKQDFDKIIELSSRALDYDPEEITFYYFLGLAYIQKDDDDNALAALKKGVAMANEKSNKDIVSDTYSIIGSIYYDKKEEKEAFAAFDSCLQWKADNIECLNNYAYYLSEEGRELDRAERMSYKTVQAEPDNSTFLDTYAWILFKQGKYGEALEYIDMAVKNDTAESAVIIEHAGDIHAMNNDIGKALEYWTSALKLDPENKAVIMKKIKLKKYVDEKNK